MKRKNIIRLIIIFCFVLFGISGYSKANNDQLFQFILESIKKINNLPNNEQEQRLKNTILVIQKLNINQDDKSKIISLFEKRITSLKYINENMIDKDVSSNIENINHTELHNKRLNRHNQVREELGLDLYTFNTRLNNTAQIRANYLADQNSTSGLHKRQKGDGYYNYDSIKSRFEDNGVKMDKEQNGIPLFSENIARQVYNCKQSDCNHEMEKQLKKGFNFFMSEKNKSYKPHYKAIVQKNFKTIGFGYAKGGNKIFVVTHYGSILD